MAKKLAKIFTKEVIQHLKNNKDEITPELLRSLRETKRGKQIALDILDIEQNEEGFYLDAFRNIISYKNIPSLKRINTKLQLHDIHIQEIKKCQEDIFYFLMNYVKIKTPKGVDFPDLRYYQLEFIDCISKDENESIVGLLPRQCCSSNTSITTSKGSIKISDLFNQGKPYQEYRSSDSLFTETRVLNIRVLTNDGYKQVHSIHKTIKLPKYKIVLENGLSLEAAHNHVVIASDNEEVYVKDCLGIILNTVNGPSKVISVQDLKIKEHMYDISIDSKDEVYYSNGILSHNSGKSVTVGIYLVHLSLFEKDVNVGIAAQKHSMATEFLTKVKDIFVNLPIWLTPGIKAWNMKSISLENGVRILSDRAGSSAFRGHTCLRGDTKIDILENNVRKTITFDNLYNIYKNQKILTKKGYKPFDGLKKVQDIGVSIILDNTQINCTKDHRILCGKYKGGKIFRQAKNLKVNHKIKSKKILKITQDTEHNYYDPINVQGDNTYLVDGVTHHNCSYLITDEAAYISGNDNNMTRFEAYLDSMLPSQSALAKKKNIFISTANGMNEFEILYSNAMKDGYDIVTEILNGSYIIYSDTVENHYQSLVKPSEILSIEPSNKISDIKVNNLTKSDKNYKVQYQKRKNGSNNSIAFHTDWKKVPRFKQDGTVKTPNEFYEEILATKGEVFFQQSYGNCVGFDTLININNINIKIGELWEML